MTNYPPQSEADKQSAANITGKEQTSKRPDKGIGIISVIVSIYLIVAGCIRISTHPSGSLPYIWGICMLVVGVAGLIYKAVTLVR